MAVVRGAGVTGPVLPPPPSEACGDLQDREVRTTTGSPGISTYLGLLAEAEVEEEAGGYCSPPPV